MQRAVQDNYRDNPFHNFRHCFSVTQMMFVLIHQLQLDKFMAPSGRKLKRMLTPTTAARKLSRDQVEATIEGRLYTTTLEVMRRRVETREPN